MRIKQLLGKTYSNYCKSQQIIFVDSKTQEINMMYMLWRTQPDNKLKSKGHDENHSQFQCTFSFMMVMFKGFVNGNLKGICQW